MQNATLIVAIIAIAAMEITAMALLHLDGVMLSAAVAAISAIATQKYTKERCNNDRDRNSDKLASHLRGIQPRRMGTLSNN
jgi:hypothetical protein